MAKKRLLLEFVRNGCLFWALLGFFIFNDFIALALKGCLFFSYTFIRKEKINKNNLRKTYIFSYRELLGNILHKDTLFELSFGVCK